MSPILASGSDTTADRACTQQQQQQQRRRFFVLAGATRRSHSQETVTTRERPCPLDNTVKYMCSTVSLTAHLRSIRPPVLRPLFQQGTVPCSMLVLLLRARAVECLLLSWLVDQRTSGFLSRLYLDSIYILVRHAYHLRRVKNWRLGETCPQGGRCI